MARSQIQIGYGIGKSVVGSDQLVPRATASECVRSLEYDSEREQMTVHFWKRGSYTYFDVEPQVFAEFNHASRQGLYFNMYVRERYSFERIS